MNITSATNPQDVSGVIGLLTFLADKEACAARLKELTDAASAATAAAAEAQKTVDSSKALIEEAAHATTKAAEIAYNVSVADSDIAARRTDLDTRTAAVELAEKASAARQEALDKRQHAVDLSLTDLAQKQEEADARYKDAQDLKTMYEAKLASLRASVA